ncbi:MAG: Nif3-like dinuclear metal center hexameric protein [Planctomycetes bacterium]|nr:Nif3-like dinuclear metal center hexameric protein [Planctomycetota bacterium]
MSVSRIELNSYCQQLLNSESFKDYCHNGVQIEGSGTIECISSSTTASLAACEQAAAHGSQALFVHHGIIWGGINSIDGISKKRIKCLLESDCSLFAFHLPLDANETWGNNRCALDAIGIPVSGTFANYKGQDIGLWGSATESLTAAELAEKCKQAFGHSVIHCPGDDRSIQKVGVVTGGGQSLLMEAATLGLDAFITGETSENCWHEAAETGCHLFACGHHATESIAIHKLCSHLAEKFELTHYCINQENPL